jgi:hypothetical protein
MVVRLALVLVALVTGGCDYLFGGEGTPPPEPEFLPVVVTAPSPDWDTESDDDLRLRVVVDREGAVRLKGKIYRPGPMSDIFLNYANRKRDLDHPLKPSEVYLRIVADRRTPWAAVNTVLVGAALPEVRIVKIQMEVVFSDPERPGCLAWCQPLSDPGEDVLTLREGEPVPATSGEEVVLLRVEGNPSAEFVLKAIAELYGRGAEEVVVLPSAVKGAK